MKVVHIYHSGILLESDEAQLFIDSVSDVDELVNFDKKVYFFATHGHGDHWDAANLKYLSRGARYILSDDIEVDQELECDNQSKIIYVAEKKDYAVENISFKTYGTTDRGVSFMIDFEGKKIFHSGDLNWWHWKNNSEESHRQEEADFKKELELIEEKNIDVAFVPVDPRLEEYYFLTAEYFVDQFQIRELFPIHFGNSFDITRKIKEKLRDNKTVIHLINDEKEIFEI